MNNDALTAIENAWTNFTRARALCPWPEDTAIGQTTIQSPGWYKHRGMKFTIDHHKPLTASDIRNLRHVAEFINRSFVIQMSAILEEHGVVPNKTCADDKLPGGNAARLVKQLRHCFAHGDCGFNPANDMHDKAAKLRELVFPGTQPFQLQINTILEPLKNMVLNYIRAAT